MEWYFFFSFPISELIIDYNVLYVLLKDKFYNVSHLDNILRYAS